MSIQDNIPRNTVSTHGIIVVKASKYYHKHQSQNVARPTNSSLFSALVTFSIDSSRWHDPHNPLTQTNRLLCTTLQWRHHGRDSVSNHQPRDCLLNRLFRRRSKETSKLRVTGLCVGNSPVTDDLSAQRDSKAENVSIWWRHHDFFH